jgi:hypothetical protein
LSLEKDCRVKPSDLFQLIQNDLQNIRDAEPLVPSEVIDKFNSRYKDEPTSKPAITNGLTQIKINAKRNYYDPTPKATTAGFGFDISTLKENAISALKNPEWDEKNPTLPVV